MLPARFVLDSQRSSLIVHTHAEGMLARLAHDLEIKGDMTQGEATIDPTGQSGTLRCVVPLSSLVVVGALSDGVVRPATLSMRDKDDIVAKMMRDVFHADSCPSASVALSVAYAFPIATITITPPFSRACTVRVNHPIQLDPQTARRSIYAMCTISLRALGSDTIKGPMSAFRVRDEIDIKVSIELEKAPH